jgi:hypothetical protein
VPRDGELRSDVWLTCALAKLQSPARYQTMVLDLMNSLNALESCGNCDNVECYHEILLAIVLYADAFLNFLLKDQKFLEFLVEFPNFGNAVARRYFSIVLALMQLG